MADAILVLNAGSSSLKYALFDADGRRTRGQTERLSADHRDDVLYEILEQFRDVPLAAVGHRVVHGGMHYAAPVRVTDAVLAELESLVPLAPLHQPHNLAPIRSLHRLRPNLIQVACFDTAFHRSMPDVAQQFALPRSFTEAGIRRYGFHGLSFEWISARLRELDPEARRVVLAHLGNGASLCAIRDGHSIATTMGFTPADGLMMGTRAGSVDSGVVFHLMRSHGLNADEVEHILNFESGLLGVSGISSDMRVLLESDRDSAKQAIALFVDRIVRELGSLAAALGGIDAVVFTGGIGEHAAPIREMVMERSAWLGLAINAAANTANAPLISVGSVRVWVLPTDEEALIADHTRRHLNMEET